MTQKFILLLTFLFLCSVLSAQPYNPTFKKETGELTGNLMLDSHAAFADSNSSFIHDFFDEKPKHPFKAGLMSAIIPGSGEYYSESYKTAISFFASEVILLSTFYYFNSLADEREKNFHKIADDPNNGWFVDKYAAYIIQKANEEGSVELKAQANQLSQSIENYQIYDPENGIIYSQSGNRSWWSLLNQIEKQLTFENGSTFSHALPYYGTQQYYELIGKYSQFSPGWYDFRGSVAGNASPSAAFLAYRDTRSKANDTHDIANNLLIAVFLNHAASAVNAALQAKWYNKNVNVSFMNRKISNENWYATTVRFSF